MSSLPNAEHFKAAMIAYQRCLQHSLCCKITKKQGLCNTVQEVHALQLPDDMVPPPMTGGHAVLCKEQDRL